MTAGGGAHRPRRAERRRWPGALVVALAVLGGAGAGGAGVSAARALPPVRLAVMTGSHGGRSLLAPGAVRLTVTPFGVTRGPVWTWATGAAGRRLVLTVTGSTWHRLWAWQVSGPYLAVWIAEPPVVRPETGDDGSDVVVVDLDTDRIAAETSIYADAEAYLTGGDLVVAAPWGAEQLRRSLTVFDLARREALQRVFGRSVVAAEVARDRIWLRAYPSRASAASVVLAFALPRRGWRRTRPKRFAGLRVEAP